MFTNDDIRAAYQSLPESSVEERRRAAANASASAAIARGGGGPCGIQRRKKQKGGRVEAPAAAAAASVTVSDEKDDDDGDSANGFPDAHMDTTDSAPFRIESMRTLASAFPHVAIDSRCELAMAKLETAKVTLSKPTASKLRKMYGGGDVADAMATTATADVSVLTDYKKDLSGVDSRRLHYDQSQHEPCEVELLRDARAQLVLPHYTHGLMEMRSHVEMSDLLRSKKLRLPVYTAAHENTLLRTHSGTFNIGQPTERTFPPCCYGTQCIAYTAYSRIAGLTEPIILMRAMSPQQWTALRDHNTQPVGTAPCVLDGRLHTTRYVCKERMGLRPGHTLQRDGVTAMPVFQLWRNLVDREGGYDRRYIFTPNENEVLLEPILAFHQSVLKARKRPNGMWTIDQSAMEWHPPALLGRVVGESLQDFRAGASSTKKPTPSSGHSESASAPPCPTPAAACSV